MSAPAANTASLLNELMSCGKRSHMLAECFDERARICEASPVTPCYRNESFRWCANLRHVSLRHLEGGDVIVPALYNKKGVFRV
jgi:hypothetical protein